MQLVTGCGRGNKRHLLEKVQSAGKAKKTHSHQHDDHCIPDIGLDGLWKTQHGNMGLDVENFFRDWGVCTSLLLYQIKDSDTISVLL